MSRRLARRNAYIIPHMRVKVKRKTRTHTKKVTRVTSRGQSKKLDRRKKPQKKKRGKTPQLVTVTNPKKKRQKRQSKNQPKTPTVKQLQRQVQRLQAELAQTKRSDAAKKGWATRRAKIAESQAARLDTEVQRAIVPRAVVPSIELVGESAEELITREAHLREPHVQRQIQQRLIEKLPEFFIQGQEYLQQREPSIMFRLIIAEQEGDFYDVVKELADEYDYDTHAIYELWNGYTLDS